MPRFTSSNRGVKPLVHQPNPWRQKCLNPFSNSVT